MGLFKKDFIQNRKVSKARFLYLYVIIGSLVGLIYFIVSIFRGWPMHWALSPVYLILSYLVAHFLYNNWKMIWFYTINVERGKFILFLNKATHFEETHKIKVAKWAYPGKNKIRKETHDIIAEKAMNGEELTKEEKKLLKKSVIACPQQPRLGFNEALLVHSLIYAHQNIQPLDDEIRDIMKLTDENILKFDIMVEAKKAGLSEYERMIEIGKRKSEELNS